MFYFFSYYLEFNIEYLPLGKTFISILYYICTPLKLKYLNVQLSFLKKKKVAGNYANMLSLITNQGNTN